MIKIELKITCPDCGYKENVIIGNDDEIVLRIPKDEANKLRYALEHIQSTGNEYIDDALSDFSDVLKEMIKKVD